jgi:hypothetical protein
MTRCSHPHSISYARYLELGGQPVSPAPVGITDSEVFGWFYCDDCFRVSNDGIEYRSGNWPCLEAPESKGERHRESERAGQGTLSL